MITRHYISTDSIHTEGWTATLNSEGECTEITANRGNFKAKCLYDGVWEVTIGYNGGTKKKKLQINYCLLDDLFKMFKIWQDVEPSWKESEAVFGEIRKL